MQTINRIQTAIINANTGFQAGMVVDSANAHRAYLSKSSCDTKPVSKCPEQMPMSLRRKMMRRLPSRRLAGQEQGQLVISPKHGTWRHDDCFDQMPAMVWATFVLSPPFGG